MKGAGDHGIPAGSRICAADVVPLLPAHVAAGALARHAARNQPTGWKVTAHSVIFAALFCWVAFSANAHGDMTLGLLGYAVAGFPLGSAVYGLTLRLRRKSRNSRTSAKENHET